MIVIEDYILPMFKTTSQGLWCGCNMCFSEENQEPVNIIGPHDLHCLCPPCMSYCLNEEAYDKSLEVRYPGYESFYPEPLTQQQIDQLWAETDSYFYEPAPTSPTNSDMHAYNGNLSHQHHRGNGDFVRAAGHHLSRLADENRGLLMAAQAGIFPAGLAYSSIRDLAEPLSELREQLFGKVGPTNKEMHSYNGNMMPGDSGHTKIPRLDPRKAPGRDTGLHEAKPAPSNKKPVPKTPPGESKPAAKPKQNVTGGRKPVKIPKVQDSQHPPSISVKPTPGETYHWDFDPWGEMIMVPGPATSAVPGNITKIPPSTAPTNKEMHAINGNTKKFGPITKAQHESKIRKKIKKQAKKGVTVNVKNTIAKSNNKHKNTKSHAEKLEKRIAKRYARFLLQPVYPPPRLGSTGDAPTKLLHGWFKQTFSMAAPATGTGTPTNCTEFIAYLSPKLFKYYSSITSYASPISIGFADSSTVTFDTNASTHCTMQFTDFANYTPLLNEAGNPSSSVLAPGARWVGGAISLECRCPMSTTAPPYTFGGLLPSQGTIGGTVIDPAEQLNRLSTTSIRNLQSTKELNSFTATAYYLPTMPNSLQFDTYTASNVSAANLVNSSIPYIGMSGCPTTATVTVTASCWFEMTQTTNNMNYSSGWSKGPKVSSEDVFDNLPRLNPLSNKLLNLGTKGASVSISGILAELRHKQEPPDIHQQLDKLMKEVSNLRVQIEEVEEEKYVSTSPLDTLRPGLSQSTIDLALVLKDRFTPGSVTSKTSKTSHL